MKAKKKNALRDAGWVVGDAAEFLELSDEEKEFIEMKLGLASLLRDLRTKKKWTQTHVAERIDSSQSRVAKMEAGDATVSLDLMVRSLLKLGASRRQLAKVMASPVAAIG